VTSKVAFKAGSSQQGKAFLASKNVEKSENIPLRKLLIALTDWLKLGASHVPEDKRKR
jgi:hypothetical protein